MAPKTTPYQLAFTLHGHASDVRSIVAPAPGVPLLLSGSRDGSALLWGPSNKGEGEWDVKLRVEAPEKKYVSCVGMTRWQGEAYLLVGSSSGILSSFTLPSMTSPPPPAGQTPEPYHTLIEHRQNLCCMDVSKNGLIATGSWDKTVVIWKDFKKVFKIEEHEQSVWAVRFVGEDRLLTASADKTILLHAIDIASGTSTVLQKYEGHTEPVRGLSLKPDGKGFWSCANDSSVNIWSFDKPSPIRSLSGHTSFVYSISAFPDGSGAISGGEDGTLRVWSETELVQTIPHASNSIWSTSIIPGPKGPSSYIASSANDTTIRFFTREESLMAPEAEREAWDKEVGSRQLDKSQVGDVKHSDLPGMEALGREGKKDGQVLMIKNNGQVEAYQWSTSASTWQQIGQVVDAIGSGRKQLYEGKEYDHVFDVDVAEGVPPLKLPYNLSENPWFAAQKFLEKNELPASYAEEVVNFIQKNTGGVQLGQETGSGGYVDPYTGASRYTGASAPASGSGSGSGGAAGGGGGAVFGGDPFTGGSAYSSQPAPKPKSAGVLPVKGFLSFKQINVAAAKTKIAQLADEVKASDASLALTSEDEQDLSEIYALLSSPAAGQSSSASSSEKFNVERFISLVQRWPEDKRFPLLDLARALASTSPGFAASINPATFLSLCNWSSAWELSKPREINALLALRGMANLFVTPSGRKNLGGVKASEWLEILRTGRTWEELGARKVPLATIALNYSIMAINGELPSNAVEPLAALILHILDNEKTDSETIYRSAVAFGNLIDHVQNGKALIVARAKGLGEKRLTDLASEIGELGA